MHIPFSPPDISEREIEEVVDTLRSGWITTGPKTKRFEREIAEWCHTNKAVCLNSATAALECTLRMLEIGPGDEVITSAYTYTASASVICHVGATPVLIDTAPDSYEMDYDQMEAAINEKTKAVIPVDLAGIICDYDRIFAVVENAKSRFHPSGRLQELLGRVAVIADGAHAFGAQRGGKMCGEIADFTAFSFHAVKNITTGEGGAVTWRSLPGVRDEELYHEFMLLSLHGQSKDALAKTKLGAWEYDIVAPYYKYNMTDIMAAMGLAQLSRYPDILARRRELIKRYDAALAAQPVSILCHYGSGHASSGHLYLMNLTGRSQEERNAFILQLAERDIAANVHYKPLPLHTAYRNLGFRPEDYPQSLQQFMNEVTLPLHTCMTDEMVEYLLETVCSLL